MPARYVAWPEDGRKVFLYKSKSRKSAAKVREVLWGDYLWVDGEESGGWLRIIWGRNGPNPQTLFIPAEDTIKTRPIEIIFLDVGQGDGAVLITPESGDQERIVVIDAGERDNMVRFLAKRFEYRGYEFEAAVLTHPDKDHYFGFQEIFSDARFGFKTIYQNGLVERPVDGTFEKLGKSKRDPKTGTVYFHELATSRADIEKHFSNPAKNKKLLFPNLMYAALNNPKIKKFAMLSTAHGKHEEGVVYMPGFAPSDGYEYTIEVLGPVVEPDANGAARLRRIESYGETKNGHSVLLRLQYGQFSVLFGGDLNEPAEKFLLRHYGEVTRFPEAGTAAYRSMIAKAAKKFRSEVMKSCHHGSEKVTDAFLETVNPAAFVISSGDEEGHVHPRPDLLGRLGCFGRGGAPIILSTEILRSTREREDAKVKERLDKAIDQLTAKPSDKRKEAIKKQIAQLAKINVDVYGAIYLKTDGKRLMTAFRIETNSLKKRWFHYGYRFLPNGELLRER